MLHRIISFKKNGTDHDLFAGFFGSQSKSMPSSEVAE
jgi:hypothetical protein